MGGGRKAAHVGAELRDDGPGAQIADAGNGAQQPDRLTVASTRYARFR
jgi:hypothetical protein